MKILIVCQFYYPENFVISKIAENLASFGHDVSVLTGKPNYCFNEILPEYKKIKFETINGVKVNRVNLYPRKQNRLSIVRNYLSFWRNSKRWVRKCKEKYDIVYSMSLSPVTILSAGNLYKKIHHVPHVVHCVDLWPESVLVTKAVRKNSIIYKILYKWSKKLYSSADKILIGSKSFNDYFKNVLNITSIPIEYVPQPSLIEKDDNIKKVDLEGDFNILYCGNLGLIQNINLIPESMSLVTNPKIKFHVIGMGPMTSLLKKQIKELHLEDKVIYHGPIIAQEAARYFLDADVFYVSLDSEGYVGQTIPNKLMMYMSFGKPIIAVLKGDGADIINESKGGFVIDNNPKIIADCIENVASLDEEERVKIGLNNQNYYNKNLSIKSISKNIEKNLLELLK